MPKDDSYVSELNAFLVELNAKVSLTPQRLGAISTRIFTMLDNAISPGVRDSLNNIIQGNKDAFTKLDGAMTEDDRKAGYRNISDELFEKTAPKAGKRL